VTRADEPDGSSARPKSAIDYHPPMSSRIRPSAPRETVQARLPDGRIFEAPPGTPVGDVLEVAAASVGHPGSAVAAFIGGRLRELQTPLEADCDVAPVTLTDTDGTRIYRRSLAFLLITAAAELFPEASVFIEHSAPTLGAYFCRVRGRAAFSPSELSQIEQRMRALVSADEPIRKTTVTRAEAIAIFEQRGEADKARLLAHREKDTIVLYELASRPDYLQGFMLPSTGRLRQFALHPLPPGFLLQYPHQSSPTRLTPFEPYPSLFATFAEAGEWLDRLGIRSTGTLNDAIAEGRLPEVSLVAEALHEARIARIAADIAHRDAVRVVMIAGPSSSGKTTFAKRLAVQLLVNGRRPFAIALDDYFLDRDETPRDERGELDFEALGALDVPLINAHLLGLIEGHTVALPRYSFLTGTRGSGQTVSLGRKDVIIIEGIHGLNPLLVPDLPPGSVYRIYVSAITQLNLDRHNRVSISDTRLTRRIVRDAATRGYSAAETLQRWESVQRGERLHIFPFTENSDAIFNSSLAHELSVLRPYAEPLLLQVRHDTSQYREASRLLSFLQWFRPAAADVVPDNSILREFIGRSILENFQWRQA
jgi:uridine kinase